MPFLHLLSDQTREQVLCLLGAASDGKFDPHQCFLYNHNYNISHISDN